MFKLIELPYTSLAPVISDQTLAFHHGKHLQTYVDNLNKLLPGSEFEALCHSERSEESILEEIVKKASGGIFNNAGQILNHELYFTQFDAPSVILSEAKNLPTGKLATQIEKQWGERGRLQGRV